MIDTEELQALADDIEANGLRQPIVLDSDGRILDGRNRYEACKLAKIEPTFETYDGDDPVGYVLSCNEHRRHMNKGQRAIATARTCLFNKHSVRDGAKAAGVASAYVSKANQVIEHAPDLADQVAAGAMPLNTAYDEAKRRKAEAAAGTDKLAKIKTEAPDLAELVEAGKLTLDEATASWKERQARFKQDLANYRTLVDSILGRRAFIMAWATGNLPEGIAEAFPEEDQKQFNQLIEELKAQ